MQISFSKFVAATLLIIILLCVHVTAHADRFDRFVRFRGIQYRADMYTYGRDATHDDLGPEFGRVTCDTGDLPHPSPQSTTSKEAAEKIKRCIEQDGGASALPIGTPVYTMRAYRPEYRLAARVGDRWIIFYATENPRAKVGADMLDLEKIVARITLSLDSSARARNQWSCKNVERVSQVENITRMMLTAPIMKQPSMTAGASRFRYWITLWFKDGTAQGLAYFPATGWLNPGLQMPQEFCRLVEEKP